MHLGAVVSLLVALILVPALVASIDVARMVRSRMRAKAPYAGALQVEDFAVLVPIWGNIKYLQNVDYLAQYASRVVLCTTPFEEPEFESELRMIAEKHGFRIFHPLETKDQYSNPRGVKTRRRMVSGTVRDRLIRDAVATVDAPYVVCLDADTVTCSPLGHLVGELVDRRLDLASIRLIPTNTNRLLGRIQRHEYRIAMRLRWLYPWLLSGACHVAKTDVHRAIMRSHSLFFQGNDVELGLLAEAKGYKTGHIPFDVPTVVPDRLGPWLRQRLAWSGGEFRLYIMNIPLIRHHPFFFAYGAVVVIMMVPLRWLAVGDLSLALAVMLGIYAAALIVLNWADRDWALLVLPFYALFTSLILVPLGIVWYVRMATADRNLGLIRPRRGPGSAPPDKLRQEPSAQLHLVSTGAESLVADIEAERRGQAAFIELVERVLRGAVLTDADMRVIRLVCAPSAQDSIAAHRDQASGF